MECGKTLKVHIVRRYFHLYRIPIIPYRRLSIVQCSGCQSTWNRPQQVPAYQLELRELQKEAKSPWYMFSGLILALLIVSAVLIITRIEHYQRSRSHAEYLRAPQVGDFYLLAEAKLKALLPEDHPVREFPEHEKYPHVLLQIVDLDVESTNFLISNYSYRRASDAEREIKRQAPKKPDYFSSHEINLSHSQLRSLYESDGFERIIRPASPR